MASFEKSIELVDELIRKAKAVMKGKSLAEAEIDLNWIRAYGQLARRCRDYKDFGLSRYPYEQGPAVGAFTGGLFEHREWPLRKGMENHQSLRPVCKYEANYINPAGYWMAFHEAAISLQQESIVEKKNEEALMFDVWALRAHTSNIRAEFNHSKSIPNCL